MFIGAVDNLADPFWMDPGVIAWYSFLLFAPTLFGSCLQCQETRAIDKRWRAAGGAPLLDLRLSNSDTVTEIRPYGAALVKETSVDTGVALSDGSLPFSKAVYVPLGTVRGTSTHLQFD
jgi:hypothetical protein